MNAIKALLRHKLLLVILFVVALAYAATPAYAQQIDDDTVIDNGIPVVYVNIDETQGTIEDMLSSVDHSVYCYGTLSIHVPEGFSYVDFPDVDLQSLEGLSMSIRGRGNSTWNGDKKPFKIKLDKKADVLGLGTNKHWVLIANAKDESLLKDRITAWLGDEMGFTWTPRGVPVDLVMTGQYYGSYYLGSYYISENVRVDSNRLNIEELKETDTDPSVITGGYLLQNGSQVDSASPDRFFTDRGADWATHTPSFDTEGDTVLAADLGEGEETFAGGELGDAYKNQAQQEYIQNFVQEVEDIIFQGGTAYRDVMDIESSAKYWWIQIGCLNGDAYATGSTYIYKYRNESKFYWGPLWDFDYGWGFNYYWNGVSAGHNWLKPMLYDKTEGGLLDEIHKQWPAFRALLVELSRDGGLIDQYADETRASAEADWAIYRPTSEKNYQYFVDNLKTWIKNRIAWLDENLDQIDDLVHKITFVVNGEEYCADYLENGEKVAEDAHRPEVEGYYFEGWAFEDGTMLEGELIVREDETLTAVLISDDEITHATDIAMRKQSDVTGFSAWFRTYTIQYEVIPTDADDQVITWTSSDESVATINNYGLVNYKKAGTVTFTATLRNGVSRDFVLEIVNGDYDNATSIAPETEEITMAVGEMTPFVITSEPSPAKVSSYVYTSDDESVVTVDGFGALTAVGPGQTQVHVTVKSQNADYEDVYLETYVTVTVTGDEPEQAEYTVTDVSAPSWTKGEAPDVTITVKRSVDDETCFEHFTGVSIDGVALGEDAFSAVAGSTVVTLPAATLDSLDVGDHEVNVAFDDGDATAKLTVAAPVAPGGDDTPGGDTPGGQDQPTPSDKPADNRGGGGTPKAGDDTNQMWLPLLVGGAGVVGVGGGLMLFFGRDNDKEKEEEVRKGKHAN